MSGEGVNSTPLVVIPIRQAQDILRYDPLILSVFIEDENVSKDQYAWVRGSAGFYRRINMPRLGALGRRSVQELALKLSFLI
ncbi:TPA: hypothetical protein DEG75_02130 [Candidatus Dependentiae bacterium]|nr:hypothetical protein [Candidatus Dependentiae bacterium]